MIEHCAGLRNHQDIGDYVLATSYLRDDHILDHADIRSPGEPLFGAPTVEKDDAL